MNPMGNVMGGYLGMGLGWLMPLAIVALLFYLFRNRCSMHDRTHEELTAQDILDKRFANGGIDEEEYREKSAQIQSKGAA